MFTIGIMDDNFTKNGWYFSHLQNAVDDVKVTLVGNKLDLDQQQGQRQVTTRRGEKVSA